MWERRRPPRSAPERRPLQRQAAAPLLARRRGLADLRRLGVVGAARSVALRPRQSPADGASRAPALAGSRGRRPRRAAPPARDLLLVVLLDRAPLRHAPPLLRADRGLRRGRGGARRRPRLDCGVARDRARGSSRRVRRSSSRCCRSSWRRRLWSARVARGAVVSARALAAILAGLALCRSPGRCPRRASGGPAYAGAILWGQTAGRLTRAFAHPGRSGGTCPFLPLLAFPWLLWPSAWRRPGCPRESSARRGSPALRDLGRGGLRGVLAREREAGLLPALDPSAESRCSPRGSSPRRRPLRAAAS